MNTIWSLTFWRDATERALKSAAQAGLLYLGGDVFNAWSVDVKALGGIALGGAGLSLLTSLASDALPFGTKGTASLAKLDGAGR